MSDLLFIVSKLAHTLVEPDSLLVLAVVAGAACLWWRPRLGRIIVSAAAAVLLTLSVLPVGAWLLAPLENRFPRPDLEQLGRIDGVVVLGGAVRTGIAEDRGVLALNRYAERIAEMLILARRLPEAKLIYAGGSGDIRGEGISEAAALAPYLEPLGLPTGRIVLESASRNTYENALETWRIARPQPGERWLLVTSSYHLPRSMGVFRSAGWDPIAYPVDYQSSENRRLLVLAPVRHWQDLNLAAHEYAGLLSYYWAGYSSSLFPGPGKD